jgi:hypothetical protein
MKDVKLCIEIGALAKEIKKLMSEGKEIEAYDKLNDLNSVLADLKGASLEMEDVLEQIK